MKSLLAETPSPGPREGVMKMRGILTVAGDTYAWGSLDSQPSI